MSTPYRRDSKQPQKTVSARTMLVVQALFLGSLLAAWICTTGSDRRSLAAAALSRPYPLDAFPKADVAAVVTPLYNQPDLVSDQQLAAVIKKLIPRFSRSHLRPNLIEHALRTWGGQVRFNNPDAISGPKMVEFLTDSARHLESWDNKAKPLLEDTPEGIHVRFGEDSASSVHHDHALAALTEAGIPLSSNVFTTRRALQLKHVLGESLRDFRLDEGETEWSSLCFALWLGPDGLQQWHNGGGRLVTFDMLVERLVRNHKRMGVCQGTHRIYTLMAMLRINEEQQGKLLSPASVSMAEKWLMEVRDLIAASQFPDGSWNPGWCYGSDYQLHIDPQEKISKRVIATGHHLEWMSIAPEKFHIPKEQIHKAAQWLLTNVENTPQSEIDQNYTFYSHVAKALAMWRKTSPAEFWTSYRENHPDAETFDAPATPPAPPTGPAAAAH